MDAVTAAAVLGCLLGAGLGLVGLVSPSTAARIVRLQTDPAHPDGVAEFRASFGGLFLATHGLGLLVLLGPYAGIATVDGLKLGVCATLGALWLGTAFGRLVAMAVTPSARVGYQAFAMIFETAVGAMIALPLASA